MISRTEPIRDKKDVWEIPPGLVFVCPHPSVNPPEWKTPTSVLLVQKEDLLLAQDFGMFLGSTFGRFLYNFREFRGGERSRERAT